VFIDSRCYLSPAKPALAASAPVDSHAPQYSRHVCDFEPGEKHSH
jgi:hypothetical protein